MLQWSTPMLRKIPDKNIANIANILLNFTPTSTEVEVKSRILRGRQYATTTAMVKIAKIQNSPAGIDPLTVPTKHLLILLVMMLNHS